MNLPGLNKSIAVILWTIPPLVSLIFYGCDAGFREVPGQPDCISIDLVSSDLVCYPMSGPVSQQQFKCIYNRTSSTINGYRCRQQCDLTDPVKNSKIEFHTDCTPIDVGSCNVTATYMIRESCTQNGLQGGLIVSGCLVDPSVRKDGIVCNLSGCDLAKSLIEVYEKCEMCRWISVFADDCTSTNPLSTYECTNVSEEQHPTSTFGCRVISCSSFGSEGKMTLDLTTITSCWEINWYDKLPAR
jgi:hypothetical protein